jgi:hypothetical protein
MLYPYSFNGITHRHLPTAEIASKQGHDDVPKLTQTDIAIEVRTQTFYSYHLLQREFHLFSYKDHGETLLTKNVCYYAVSSQDRELCGSCRF